MIVLSNIKFNGDIKLLFWARKSPVTKIMSLPWMKHLKDLIACSSTLTILRIENCIYGCFSKSKSVWNYRLYWIARQELSKHDIMCDYYELNQKKIPFKNANNIPKADIFSIQFAHMLFHRVVCLEDYFLLQYFSVMKKYTSIFMKCGSVHTHEHP